MHLKSPCQCHGDGAVEVTAAVRQSDGCVVADAMAEAWQKQWLPCGRNNCCGAAESKELDILSF